MRATLRTILVLGLVLALSPAFSGVFACPGCKEAVAAEGDEGDVSRAGIAYSASVLFMLSMPFLLASGFGTAFYCLYRRQQRLQAARSQSESRRDEPALV